MLITCINSTDSANCEDLFQLSWLLGRWTMKNVTSFFHVFRVFLRRNVTKHWIFNKSIKNTWKILICRSSLALCLLGSYFFLFSSRAVSKSGHCLSMTSLQRLSLTWSQTLETGFLVTCLICTDTNHSLSWKWYDFYDSNEFILGNIDLNESLINQR